MTLFIFYISGVIVFFLAIAIRNSFIENEKDRLEWTLSLSSWLGILIFLFVGLLLLFARLEETHGVIQNKILSFKPVIKFKKNDKK